MNAGMMSCRGRAAGLLALVVLLGACQKQGRLADASRNGGSNLLLITLDTTRADRIGAYGDARAATPNLDRLAREGVRFDRAYTSVPLTLPAHATLMTGREPPAHQVRNNGNYVLPQQETTLAEAFKAAGFSTQAMIAAFVLEGKFGLAQGFDGYDDKLDGQQRDPDFRGEIPAERVLAKYNRWLESSPASPFFCWVHFYDPHFPYQPPSSFRERFPDDPYRGEIAYMDEAIGRMLQDLDRRGLLQNTLVVVAGDHGEGLGEHGEQEHGVFCYDEVLRVPLIFHQPRLFPGNRVVSRPVGLVDLLPTLLELYRLPSPPGVQGRSFAGLLTAKRDPDPKETRHYFESMYGMEQMGFAPLSGLMRGSLKYISLPRPELYDLAADPLERDNLYLKKNVLAKQMARELDDYLARTVTGAATTLRPRQSYRDQAHLRALGYLASTEIPPRTGAEVDPKDGIRTLNLLREGRLAIRSGDLAVTENKIRELRAAGVDRTLPLFHDLRYELAMARKDPIAIEKTLLEATSFFPDSTRFMLLQASFYHKQGKERETEKIARRILAIDAKSFEAHLLLGEIYRNQGASAKALEHFQSAWALEMDDAKLAVALADLQIESGKADQALTTLRKLLKNGFGKDEAAASEIQGQAAKLLVKLGQPELAENLLQELVREQGGNPAHWTQLGLAQLDQGQGDQAIRSFQRALDLDPKQALALSGLGTLHLTLFRQNRDRQNLNLAAGFFAKALAADGKLITALNGLGVASLYLGDVPVAIQHLRMAIQTDKGFVSAYFNLAIAQLSIGRKGAARETLGMIRRRFSGRLTESELGQLAALQKEVGA